MKTKAIFFDLDGTLLPMDQDLFVKDYLHRLAAYMAQHGYDPKAVAETVMEGVAAMVKNDGSVTNEQAFWNLFTKRFGEKSLDDKAKFEEFYRTEFQKVAASCGHNERAKEIVELVKAKGFKPVLATNPLFPKIATHSRVRWAGLEPEDFEYISTYEDSNFCKPNPKYYQQILDKLDLKAEECVMVGNDSKEDTVPAKLGMPVFLLTESLINRGEDISLFDKGGYDELVDYVNKIV